MPDMKPNELVQAEKLIYEAKFDEALEIISNFETKEDINPKDQLSSLILKGRIYSDIHQYQDAVEIGEVAYQMSKKVGGIMESIDALCLRANMFIFGKIEQAFECLEEAEKLLNEITDNSSLNYMQRKSSILHNKAWVYHYKGIFEEALECTLQCLEIREKLGRKFDIASTFILIGLSNMRLGDRNAGLEYAMKSLAIQQELNNQIGIAWNLYFVGLAYSFKGNFNQAIDYCKKSLVIEDISIRTKVNALNTLGNTHLSKGELNQALKYLSPAVELAKKENYIIYLGDCLRTIGYIYEMKGNDYKAIEYYKRSLAVLEKTKYSLGIGFTLEVLISINIDNSSRKQAHKYLERLKELTDQTGGGLFTQMYLNGKADFLKTSGRTRDRAKAEEIWRQIVTERISYPRAYISALISLCTFLIEELEMSNDSEILDELNPLIVRYQNIAERNDSYIGLIWTKLFQAKVALIGMNIEEGKKLMTQAQHVAELHELTKLAQIISHEHDALLEQINQWETLKTRDAPMADRIKLASVQGVINQIEGRRALEIPELVDEEPVLLLITAKGGVLLFSYPFAEEWKFDDDLFSGFLNSFSSISDEIFSEGLDRAKFGQYTVLINSVGNFSVCYLFKGQSYLALQKLNDFTKRIQDEPSIWQTLEKFYKTSQVLEIKDNNSLESLINEIFIGKSLELVE
jgi:tetratricopeptide (TPR) repeat protein